MNRTLLSKRISSLLAEVSRLSNALCAMSTMDLQRYPENYELLSTDAALRAEQIACRMRHLVYGFTTVQKHEYLTSAANVLGITITAQPGLVEITLPGLLPKKKQRSAEYLTDPLGQALGQFVKDHPLSHFESCIICFCHIYAVSGGRGRIRDYDNLEMKQILDVVCAYLILNEHLMRYTASKENGGKTFPDYVGALMADELDHCIQLSKIYRSLKQQEDEMRQAQIAEQDRVYQQSVNTEKEKAVGAALQIIRSGGTLKNDTLCYYKDDGSFVETSLILYLMREYHIDVPLRTQGWIKERLASATVQEDFCGSVTYYRAKKSPCSQKFFDCMRDLILAVHNAKKEAA